MIKKHGLTFIIIRALARQLQSQADFLFRLIGEEERLVPSLVSGPLAAHEQPSLNHATSDEPPVDWLAQTDVSDAPPADWLARVQQHAPTLLNSAHQPMLSAISYPQGPGQPSQRPALALHTGDRGGKLPFYQPPIFGGTDGMPHASIEATSSLRHIKQADNVSHASIEATSSLHQIKPVDNVSHASIEATSSLRQIKNTDDVSHATVEPASSLHHIKQTDNVSHASITSTSSLAHINDACDISHTSIPSISFLRFHPERNTTNGASHRDNRNVEPALASGSLADFTVSGFGTDLGASRLAHRNVEPALASGFLSASTTHQESVPMKITSRRSWSATRQPAEVNNPARLHRPATVSTYEPGLPASYVLSTPARLNHTHASDASGNSYGPLADTLPDTYFLDQAPTHPQTSWPYLDRTTNHPHVEPELASGFASWPHMGHAFSLPTLTPGTVAPGSIFSGTISPDYWPPLPPEPTNHPHVEPALASGSVSSGFGTSFGTSGTISSGSLPSTIASGFATSGTIFSSSTAWAHHQRLNHEQRGGTWSE